MGTSSRNTATTLSNYPIVIVGAVLVSLTIGVECSKLQWLVAARGAAIGFGLPAITGMHGEIHRRFAEEGITIACPQRVLHLNTQAPLQVEVIGGVQVSSAEVK